MRTVLLSGTSGFVGRFFLNLFMAREKDVKLVLITSNPIDGMVSISREEIAKRKQIFEERGIESIDELILIGAFSPKNRKEENDRQGACSNIIEMQNLLSSLPNIPKRIFYCSTTGVYDEGTEVVSEDSLIAPQNLYAHSKYFCENMLRSYVSENDCKLYIARFGSIYGPGEKASNQSLIKFFIDKIRNDEEISVYGNGTLRRSYIYVQDVCNLLYEYYCMKDGPEIINFASDYTYSVQEIILLLQEVIGKKVKVKYVQDNYVVARLSRYDNTKRKQYFRLQETELKSGLQSTYLYWENEDCIR